MNTEKEKCVILIDEELPTGIIANTSAILGVTIGMKNPTVVGCDVTDYDSNVHSGIIKFPIPILKSSKKDLKVLREKLYDDSFSDLTIVDFTDLAQSCKNYDEYIEKMKICPQAALSYMGLAICGDKKKVNKLTSNLPLLR